MGKKDNRASLLMVALKANKSIEDKYHLTIS